MVNSFLPEDCPHDSVSCSQQEAFLADSNLGKKPEIPESLAGSRIWQLGLAGRENWQTTLYPLKLCKLPKDKKRDTLHNYHNCFKNWFLYPQHLFFIISFAPTIEDMGGIIWYTGRAYMHMFVYYYVRLYIYVSIHPYIMWSCYTQVKICVRDRFQFLLL